MRSRKFSYYYHKLKTGFRLRCPVCEQGKMFSGLFRMTPVCPYCLSRFERAAGESIGGVYINVAAAEFTAVGGFFLVNSLFEPPVMHQLLFWIPYVIVFTLFFYRHARGLWVGLLFLFDAVYPDPDYEREYIAPDHVRAGRAHHEHE